MLHPVESRISSVEGEPGRILLENLEIASPSGCTMLTERNVEVRAGERVLVLGEPGTGKTLLFRAISGLWPWGSGRVVRPRGEEIVFMPRSPYMPPGTLREVLAYPANVARFSESAYAHALTRLGLEHLVPMLDRPEHWSSRLSEEEQQSLAFARAVLRAPPWLLVDDLFGAVDEETRRHLLEVLRQELQHTGIIHVGRSSERDPLFSRVLHLVKDPASRRLARGRSAPSRSPGKPLVGA